MPAFLGTALLAAIGPPPAALGGSPQMLFQHARRSIPGSDFEATVFGWLAEAKLQSIALWWFPGWNLPLGYDSISESLQLWINAPKTKERPASPYGSWLIDRLTQTYVDDWSTTSLHAELRWLQGAEQSPFPDRVMQERVVDFDLLVAEIAKRAVRPESAARRHTGQDLTDQAVQLITHGRPELAASLFESAQLTAPPDQHGDLQSRRGFCLIGCAPDRALEILAALADSALDNALLQYNLAVAAACVGDGATAEYHLARSLGADDVEDAYLWSMTEDRRCLLVIGSVHSHAELLRASL